MKRDSYGMIKKLVSALYLISLQKFLKGLSETSEINSDEDISSSEEEQEEDDEDAKDAKGDENAEDGEDDGNDEDGEDDGDDDEEADVEEADEKDTMETKSLSKVSVDDEDGTDTDDGDEEEEMETEALLSKVSVKHYNKFGLFDASSSLKQYEMLKKCDFNILLTLDSLMLHYYDKSARESPLFQLYRPILDLGNKFVSEFAEMKGLKNKLAYLLNAMKEDSYGWVKQMVSALYLIYLKKLLDELK